MDLLAPPARLHVSAVEARSLGIVEVYTMRGRALYAAMCGPIGAGLVASCEPRRAADGVALSDAAGLRMTNITTRPTDIALESCFVRRGIEPVS